MLNRVVRVTPLADYRLAIEFDDGVSGIIDLAGELTGPMFEPLRDPATFARAAIDDFGVVCWPNGADLAPDALYRTINAKPEPADVSAADGRAGTGGRSR